VLSRHPNLIIDFAHFGMSNATWAEQIALFMEKYSGVYSDLACYTSAEVVRNFRAQFWKRPNVAQRTMFGTDYDVMLAVADGITLEKYYQNFFEQHNAGSFTAEELNALSCTNPKIFLGI
jgi:predicted TIM-barrel fold metal-dependent hydrolase